MTGEKKSSESTNRLSVKNGKKLLSRTSKPASSTISSPPKAAIAASNTKQEEVHHRRNLNDILRSRSADQAGAGNTPPLQDATPDRHLKAGKEVDGVNADRVAELERALSLARDEQNALKEELEKARRKGEKDREDGRTLDERPITPEATSHQHRQDTEEHDTWSDTRSSPRSYETSRDQPYPTTSNERPSSPHNHAQDALLRQNHDLRYKLARLQDQLLSQNTTYRANLSHALVHNELEWNDLRSRLHATEKESQQRLQQLLSLKSSISSLTRSESQVTDAGIADAFEQLANRIREWVISSFRRTKLDVTAGDLPAETVDALKALTVKYTEIESADRLALYQALISRALMQIFDDPVILGIPDSGPLSAIRVFAQDMDDTWTGYREWRRATICMIEANEKFASAVQRGRENVLHRMAGEIAHLLFTLTNVNLTSNAQAALLGILNTAADLQRILALQKARYCVTFFCIREGNESFSFDEQRMDAINDLDSITEEASDKMEEERQMLLCVFPCLEKFGDEGGEHVEMSNVLLKAKVCCGVG